MKRRNVETSKGLSADRAHDRCDRDALDVWTFGRLDVSPAPDLTRRIMGRLGYMRVPPAVARKRRIALWAGRCACVAIAGIAVALGAKAFEASPDARRPAEITMPAAISSDFHEQQSRFGSMIRLIQQAPIGIDDTEQDAQPANLPGYEPVERHDWHEIDEELNRSAVAPVRWV